MPACLLTLVLFSLYVLTTPAAVPLGDSGEFITAACTLGIPHPPGSPIYVWLGKLACLVPISTPAWRVNFFSGLCAVVTCLSLYAILVRLAVNRWAACGAALLLGVSRTFWSQAVVAEVYTLNTAFIGVITWLAIRFRQGGRSRDLYWASVLVGLSLTNHWPLAVLAIPAWLVYLLWAAPTRMQCVRRLPACLGLACLGLLPYGFLPWRSLQQPYLDWGNPENWSNFYHHVARTSTSERLLEAPAGASWTYLRLIGIEFLKDTRSLGILLAVVGSRWCWRRARAFGWLCWLTIGTYLLVVVFWMQLPVGRLFLKTAHINLLPVQLFLCGLAGCGLHSLFEQAAGGPQLLRRCMRPILLVPALVNGIAGYPLYAQSGWAVGEAWGRRFLEALPRDATLFLAMDLDAFLMAYVQGVTGVRPDLTLYDEGGLMLHPRRLPDIMQSETEHAFYRQIKEEGFRGTRAVYLATTFRYRGDPERIHSTGMGYQLGPRVIPCETADPPASAADLVPLLEPHYRNDPWYVMLGVVMRRPLADYYLERLAACHRAGEVTAAAQLEEKITTLAARDPLLLTELGWAYFLLGERGAKIEALLAASLDASHGHFLQEVPDVFVLRGLLAARGQDWPEAIYQFREALARNPVQYEANIYLAVAQTAIGEWAAARHTLQRLRETYPPSPLLQEILALVAQHHAPELSEAFVRRVRSALPPPMKRAR